MEDSRGGTFVVAIPAGVSQRRMSLRGSQTAGNSGIGWMVSLDFLAVETRVPDAAKSAVTQWSARVPSMVGAVIFGAMFAHTQLALTRCELPS